MYAMDLINSFIGNIQLRRWWIWQCSCVELLTNDNSTNTIATEPDDEVTVDPSDPEADGSMLVFQWACW